MKKTAFYDCNLKYGAQMRELFGYYLPWEYSVGHIDEHIGTRENVSICDLDYMAEFVIEGSEALEYIQYLCTNDFRKMIIGDIKYTAMCNFNGNMVDDGTVWKLGETSYLFITGDESDYDWIKKNSNDFNVSIKNITTEHTTLAVQGPKSIATLKKLIDSDLGDLKYYSYVNNEINGIPVILGRMGYTGELGYELHFDPQHYRKIWSKVMEAGNEFNIVPLGQAALESLRQEAGYILVGNEHDKDTTPFEAWIGWVVKFDKENFIGKDSLNNIKSKGINRRLAWFKLGDEDVPQKGDHVLIKDKKIGEITSGSYSPTLGNAIAVGYVSPEYAVPGMTYDIRIENKSIKARVSVVPLYDPDNNITKGKCVSFKKSE